MFKKRGWKRLSPTRLEHLLCLRGQLLPVRVVETTSGALEYWARQADIDHVSTVPVALAFTLLGGMQVDPTTTYLSVDDPLPPTRIGEVGLVVDGNKAVPYPVETLGEEGVSTFRRLGELITELGSARAFFQDLSALPSELQVLTQRLAMAYQEAHEARQSRARSLAESPHIFQATTDVPVPAAVPIQGVLAAFSNASSGARGWERKADRFPRYTYRAGENTTKVELRSSDTLRPDERTILSLWKKVRTFSDLDGDVFLMLLAQAMSTMETGEAPNISTWAIAARMLDYRGIQPIIKKEESPSGTRVIVRRAGHRTEDLAKIAECMSHLEDTWVTIRQMIETPPKTGRGKARSRLYTHESRLIVIDERMRQKQLLPDEDATFDDLEPIEASDADTSIPVAWHFRIGTWIEPFLTGPNPHMAWLCQQALRYNPEKELLEKRLARYFLFHLRIYAAQQQQTIVRSINTLFHELTLPVDTRNPERTRQRFEKALERLVQDRQLDEWEYLEANPPLPRTEWLPVWFSWKMRFSATPPVVIEGSTEAQGLVE
jgi:hypothetical protein